MDLRPCTLSKENRVTLERGLGREKGRDVLVSLDVTRDLVFEAEWDTVQRPGHRCGIRGLVDGGGEGAVVICDRSDGFISEKGMGGTYCLAKWDFAMPRFG